jgi:hypothetical protein
MDIRSTELGLSELVEESNLIVEVQYLLPSEEVILVNNIDPSLKKPAPPFIKKGYVFKIKDVYKNTGKITIPDTIDVPDETWRRSLNKYKVKYAGGRDKLFTVNEYVTEVKKIEKALVLFLHHFQGTYELTAAGAYEGIEGREKVKVLLGLV